VRHGGLLYLTSTDGFCSGGKRPGRSLAAYGGYLRALPWSNEQGLRMVIGGRSAALPGWPAGCGGLAWLKDLSVPELCLRCGARAMGAGGGRRGRPERCAAPPACRRGGARGRQPGPGAAAALLTLLLQRAGLQVRLPSTRARTHALAADGPALRHARASACCPLLGPQQRLAPPARALPLDLPAECAPAGACCASAAAARGPSATTSSPGTATCTATCGRWPGRT
jgi:hypothetical protein